MIRIKSGCGKCIYPWVWNPCEDLRWVCFGQIMKGSHWIANQRAPRSTFPVFLTPRFDGLIEIRTKIEDN